ncbi:lytic transglycosylase domain-containing protein [Robbsia andropogonis]|uniref:lytic transglycosylase domain-containing protein n=1 Tax=Robbsia andropogonis TaxID=28092 RepID=UPI002A6B0A1F|nr:lytic transglycosylase domain-containing protein [Robbsia andropogonis]
MANEKVISVNIDDQQFKAFYQLFQEYEAAVEAMPEDWKRQNEEMRKAAASAGALDAAAVRALNSSAGGAGKVAEGVKKATDAQKEFRLATESSGASMGKMVSQAKSLGHELFGIGKFLMKIGAIGVGISGISGILGTLSLRELAMSAVRDRKEARGMGVSTGQLRAFQNDFQGIIDPSILQQTADAQNSFASRPALMRASGLSYNQVATMAPDQLAQATMMRLHDWWSSTPAQMRTQENFGAMGFSAAGYSLADARNIGDMSREKLQGHWGDYQRDSKSFDVNNRTTDAWLEFANQISRAGTTIETSLTNKLVSLSPSMSGLVKTITEDAEILLNSALTPDNVKKVSDGINSFTSYLSSGQAKSDIEAIGANIGKLADALKWAADHLSWITDTLGPKPGQTHESIKGLLTDPKATIDNSVHKKTWDEIVKQGPSSLMDRVKARTFLVEGARVRFKAEEQNGLPLGLLAAQQQVESGGNPFAVSKRGAVGIAQFMRDTFQGMGGANPYDPYESTDLQAKMDARLKKKYGGDIRKALAAYNWGEGNLDRDIAKNGANWERGLPDETTKYLAKILAELQKPQTTSPLVIQNQTAARISQQMNAAAK